MLKWPYFSFLLILLLVVLSFCFFIEIKDRKEVENRAHELEHQKELAVKNIDSLIKINFAIGKELVEIKNSIQESEARYNDLKNKYLLLKNEKSNNARSFNVLQLDSFWASQH